jgi:drug/metabolite transporter (DMT)-like permease
MDVQAQQQRMPRALTPVVWLLLGLPPLVWSSLIVVGRAVITEVPPFSLTLWSMVTALLVLIPIGGAGVARQWATVVREWKQLTVSAAFGVAIFKSVYYLGIEYTTAVNASILGPTLPIMIAGCAWMVLGEQMNAIQLAGVVVTLLGVVLISVQGDIALLIAFRFNSGDILILIAFAAMAIYTTLLRKAPSALSPWTFVTVIFTLATLMLVPFYLVELTGGTHPAVPWNHAWAVAYIGVVTYILGILFWNIAVARVGATLPALFAFLIPVFGTLLAMTFLGERVYWYHLAGIAFTITGLFLAIGHARSPATAGEDAGFDSPAGRPGSASAPDRHP